jgi:hypothetical protein
MILFFSRRWNLLVLHRYITKSKPVAGFAAQISSEVAHGQVSDSSPTPLISVGDVAAQRTPASKNSNPMRGFLQ